MAAPSQPASRQTLNSWKEIAAHFGREVRTVQRWEKEEGLPVHRHFHHRLSSVYAMTDELEAWLRERQALPADGSLPEDHEEIPRDSRPRPMAWLGVAAAVVLVLAATGWALLRHKADAAGSAPLTAVAFRSDLPIGNFRGALLGDVNGDGKDDFVLSTISQHEIYIVFGNHSDTGFDRLPSGADIVIRGTENASYLATQVLDLNGDGLGDVVISTLLLEPDAFHGTGSTYILWGRRVWPSNLTLPKDADVTLRLNEPQDARLQACILPGRSPDLNQDGIPDLILGASEYSPGGRRSAGAVFFVLGRKHWPRAMDVAREADVTIEGAHEGEGLAGACAVGDFNGDGRPDLAVHAAETTLWNLLGGRGRTYLFYGREQWPRVLHAEADADFRVDGARPDGYPGARLLADVNGDGRDDLIIGCSRLARVWPETNEHPDFPGEIAIWFGGPDRRGVVSAANADVVISGDAPAFDLGSALASADFDGDGVADLVVSQPGRGQVALLYGRRDWPKRGRLQDFSPATLFRGEPGAGYDHLHVGDADGDGLPDLLFFVSADAYRYKSGSGQAWWLPPYRAATLDVRPSSKPNVVHVPGLMVATLYGSSRAPGDEADPATLRMAGVAPNRFVRDDYNHDGAPDLQLFFETAEMKLTPQTQRVTLRGRTRSGLPIAAGDSIVVVRDSPPPAPRARATPQPIADPH